MLGNATRGAPEGSGAGSWNADCATEGIPFSFARTSPSTLAQKVHDPLRGVWEKAGMPKEGEALHKPLYDQPPQQAKITKRPPPPFPVLTYPHRSQTCVSAP